MDIYENEIEARKKQAAFWLEYSQQLSTAIRYVEALAAAERAVALDESSAEAWYVKGTCQAMLVEYEQARVDFEYALVQDDSYVPAWELDPGYFEAVKKKKKRLEVM